MKKTLPLLVLFAFLIYVLPLASFFLTKSPLPKQESQPTQPQTTTQPPVPNGTAIPTDPLAHTYEPLLILDESTDTVLTVPLRDFVMGAVAAEMPMTYPDEALKAQAVAAHSYALAVKATADLTDPLLKGAYFRANPSQRFGFVTDAVMQTMWGDHYTEYAQRLSTLVDEVLPQVLQYDGAVALACYHAVSNGTTESAQAVWGNAVPYLVPVASPLDLTNENYEVDMTYTAQELSECIGFGFSGITLSGTPDTWVTALEHSPSGYVTRVSFGNAHVSGVDFRNALSLRSTDFSITYGEDALFHIVTHGYGHGVGMSQYGANAMALAGKTYAEILAHYYPGTVLSAIA